MKTESVSRQNDLNPLSFVIPCCTFGNKCCHYCTYEIHAACAELLISELVSPNSYLRIRNARLVSPKLVSPKLVSPNSSYLRNSYLRIPNSSYLRTPRISELVSPNSYLRTCISQLVSPNLYLRTVSNLSSAYN